MARACVFCGRSPSSEHALSQWLVREIHRQFPSPTYDLAYQIRGLAEQDRRRDVYDPAVVVRAACSACNQTWMSALESRAKSALLAAIRGDEPPELSEATSRDVAAWASLKAIMFEQLSPSTAVVPREACRALYNFGRAPRHFSVRMALCDSGLVFWSRRVIAEVETPEGLRARAVCVTLVVGHLVVQTLFDPFDECRDAPLVRSFPGVRSVHPSEGPFNFDTQLRLDDELVHDLGHDVFQDAPDPSPFFDAYGPLRPALVRP